VFTLEGTFWIIHLYIKIAFSKVQSLTLGQVIEVHNKFNLKHFWDPISKEKEVVRKMK
jgi:hypothetical protein